MSFWSGVTATVITVEMFGQITSDSTSASPGLLGTTVSMSATLNLAGNGNACCAGGYGTDYDDVVVGYEVEMAGALYVNDGYHLSVLTPANDPNFPVYQYAIGGFTTGPNLLGVAVEGFTFSIFSTDLPGFAANTSPAPSPVDSDSPFYYGADFCGYLLSEGGSFCGDISTVSVRGMAPAPEPTASALLAVGLLGAGLALHRRRVSSSI